MFVFISLINKNEHFIMNEFAKKKKINSYTKLNQPTTTVFLQTITLPSDFLTFA